MQTRDIDQAGPRCRHSDAQSPGDANVMSCNKMKLVRLRRSEPNVEVTVLAGEQACQRVKRVPADFGATIREMQQIRRQTLSHYDPAIYDFED